MKQENILKIILAAVFLLSLIPWMIQGVPFSDDLRTHLAHVYDMKENGFPTSSRMMFEIYSGFPIFQFYSLVPYYITYPFTLMLPAVTALKASIVFSYFIAILSMFLACNILFKDQRVSVVAATVYTWFPYHFINSASRGAFNELWGYSLFPLAVALFIKALKEPSKNNTIYATLATSVIVLTHVPTAWMLGVFYGCYILYHIFTIGLSKSLLKATAFILLGTILLTSFSIEPLFVESNSVSFSILGGTSVFGFSTPGLSVEQMFHRGFGNMPDGQRYFYLGYSLLAFVLIALVKIKESRFYVGVAVLSILIILFPFVLQFIPLASVLQFVFRLLVVVGFCVAVCSGLAGAWLADRKPEKSTLIVIGLILFILLDFMGANNFHMTGQPTENFINHPAAVDALKQLKEDPDYFLVFSPFTQADYMYTGHWQMGANWAGYLQGSLPKIHKLYSDLNDAFINELQIGNLNKTLEISNVMGQIGVKYIVLPCINDLDKYYKMQYNNGQYCVYDNPYATPIITSEYGEVFNEKFNTNKIIFDVENQNNSIIVIKIGNFHWRGFIDGKEVPITEIYPNYMSIESLKGKHNVELVYKSTNLQTTTLLISIISLVGILYMLFNHKHKVFK
jgi:hypothetical protein